MAYQLLTLYINELDSDSSNCSHNIYVYGMPLRACDYLRRLLIDCIDLLNLPIPIHLPNVFEKFLNGFTCLEYSCDRHIRSFIHSFIGLLLYMCECVDVWMCCGWCDCELIHGYRLVVSHIEFDTYSKHLNCFIETTTNLPLCSSEYLLKAHGRYTQMVEWLSPGENEMLFFNLTSSDTTTMMQQLCDILTHTLNFKHTQCIL